jgi:thiosulfate/3-mercaptopyruvate sulfurtransferase
MNRSLLPRRLKAVPVRYRSFSSLVLSPTELSNALTAQRSTAPSSPIVPISADWYLPTSLRNGYDEYLKLRIPNARFLDIDRVKDSKSPYPHMLPDSETFTTTMRALGIRRDDTVVVYDSPHDGIFAAPRAVWMLRVFGHPKVHLLDNFRGWVERGFPTESGEVQNGGWEESDYPLCRRDNELVVTYEEMVKLAGGGGGSGVQVLDARPTGRFWGTQEEPRTGLSSGHVPGLFLNPSVFLGCNEYDKSGLTWAVRIQALDLCR